MTITVEQITEAALVLDALFEEGAHHEVDGDTYFSGTATKLRWLAEARKPKPRKPNVFVNPGEPNDTAVYIERPDGRYIGVYVGDDYTKGYHVNVNLIDHFDKGASVYGGE